MMVEVLMTKTCPREQRQVLRSVRRWLFAKFYRTARQKIAPTDRHTPCVRPQIPRSAARILQSFITGDVDGEAGTQLPHCLGRHSRVRDGNEWVVIWATLYQK